jgi:hypothetical protein
MDEMAEAAGFDMEGALAALTGGGDKTWVELSTNYFAAQGHRTLADAEDALRRDTVAHMPHVSPEGVERALVMFKGWASPAEEAAALAANRDFCLQFEDDEETAVGTFRFECGRAASAGAAVAAAFGAPAPEVADVLGRVALAAADPSGYGIVSFRGPALSGGPAGARWRVGCHFGETWQEAVLAAADARRIVDME